MPKQFILLLVVTTLTVVAALVWFWQRRVAEAPYAPNITTAEFVVGVNNPYFTLTPGKTFVYESKTGDGLERIEVAVTSETRKVYGITTTIVHDKVFLNGELIENTYDWYAQDRNGNVWYLGEDSQTLKGGKVTGTHGSWEAWSNGALPGIIMPATPKVGDTYRQEYSRGIAEDQATVVSFGEAVTVPSGSFTGCLKTRDFTMLESGADEYKFYCLGVGGLVLEVGVANGERSELVKVQP